MSGLVLVAELADRRVALRAVDVHSVVELDTISRVPRAPDFIAGLAALRSRALTVVDCCASLGLPAGVCPPAGAQAVVVEHNSHLYALLVEGVDDVVESHGDVQAVPGDFGAGWERAASGMIETDRGPALLLDVGALVAGPCDRAA